MKSHDETEIREMMAKHNISRDAAIYVIDAMNRLDQFLAQRRANQ